MPNKIVHQVLGCFGLDYLIDPHPNTTRPATPTRPYNQAPAHVAPPSLPCYIPGQNYSIAELNQFATRNLPNVANRPRFKSHLRDTLLHSEISRPDKAMLCKHLAMLMTDQDYLECNGATRQANYFAAYCVDLSLQELELQYSAAMEEDLRNVLTLWVNTLCPAQTEFNLNGVIYTRAEVLDMLASTGLISRQLQQPGATLAQHLERLLRGQGSGSNYQTVHEPAVRDNGSRVLNIMKTKHGQTKEISHSAVRTFVANAAKNHPFEENILAGMNYCLFNTNRDSSWSVQISPQGAIKEVVKYIQSVPNRTMRSNLTNALLERLREINVEGPCISGVLQRLVDVPNGIDPDMNFAGASRQIGEEMATLAGKTHAQFTELIDEGFQAIKEEHHSDVTQTIASKIGRDMFQARVAQDMKLMGGLSEAELAPHRERLKAGFD